MSLVVGDRFGRCFTSIIKRLHTRSDFIHILRLYNLLPSASSDESHDGWHVRTTLLKKREDGRTNSDKNWDVCHPLPLENSRLSWTGRSFGSGERGEEQARERHEWKKETKRSSSLLRYSVQERVAYLGPILESEKRIPDSPGRFFDPRALSDPILFASRWPVKCLNAESPSQCPPYFLSLCGLCVTRVPHHPTPATPTCQDCHTLRSSFCSISNILSVRSCIESRAPPACNLLDGTIECSRSDW